MKSPLRKLEGSTVFMLSYLAAMLAGGFVLWLPISNPGTKVSLLDALFTATSALCVTGLTVVDTGTAYSYFGQGVILLLIQAGGLGITTFSVWFFLSLGREVGFKSRFFLQSSFSSRPTDQLRQLLRLIFFFTFTIELAGAILLFLYWLRVFPAARAFYLSLFHSISAFCNAGFSLFPDNLIAVQKSLIVNMTITGLIILGGIGFPIIYETVILIRKKWRQKRVRMSLHARLALLTSFILIVSGSLVIYGVEYDISLDELSMPQGLMVSYFHAVSARTAGFNTIDLGLFTNASLLVLIILMFIGASPGSCGGGVKTTTFALLGGILWNRIKGKTRVNLFHRTVPEELVSRAMTLLALSGGLVLTITTLILMVEGGNIPFPQSQGKFMEVLFEVVSAFGTVGLSVGITPHLEPLSKLLIILTMYLGRVGILSLGYAIAKKEERYPILYGEEGVIVG